MKVKKKKKKMKKKNKRVKKKNKNNFPFFKLIKIKKDRVISLIQK